MRINTKTLSVSDIGAFCLVGNLATLAIVGSLIYRHQQPPQLSGAVLATVNLPYVDFHDANLEAAVLTDCNLGGANLSGANLRGANLVRANLAGSNLHGADLREADLRGTNLERANLQAADLGSAIYNDHTAWTDGVDPQALGARFQARTSACGAAGTAAVHSLSRIGE